MDWQNLLSFFPLPVALGMVLYVNHRIDDHIKKCPVRELIDLLKEANAEMHKDIREIRDDVRNMRS